MLLWNSSLFYLYGNFLKLLIKFRFPTIQQMTTKEFAQWLSNPTQLQPLVIDVRTQTEYAGGVNSNFDKPVLSIHDVSNC
jgi:hypothetical protein